MATRNKHDGGLSKFEFVLEFDPGSCHRFQRSARLSHVLNKIRTNIHNTNVEKEKTRNRPSRSYQLRSNGLPLLPSAAPSTPRLPTSSTQLAR